MYGRGSADQQLLVHGRLVNTFTHLLVVRSEQELVGVAELLYSSVSVMAVRVSVTLVTTSRGYRRAASGTSDAHHHVTAHFEGRISCVLKVVGPARR